MTYKKNIFAVFAITAVLALSPTMATSFAQVATETTTVVELPELTLKNADIVNSLNLAKPQSLVYDKHSNLWTLDAEKERVVMFETNPVTKEIVDTTADLVLGLPTDVVNTVSPQVSEVPLKPVAIAIDSNDNVYVVDAEHNRVVMFVDPITTDAVADVVIGQPDMETVQVVLAPTAETLNNPTAIEVVEIKDPVTKQVVDEKVVIADTNNNRVLVYDQTDIEIAFETQAPIRAEYVIGQELMTEAVPNKGQIVVDATTIDTPVAIAIDERIDPITQELEQKMIIADQANHRVLVYALPIVENAPEAEFVIGQIDVTKAIEVTTPTVKSLQTPSAIVVDEVNDRLLIADIADERVLEYVLPITQDAPAAVKVSELETIIVEVPTTEVVTPILRNDLPAMEIENLDLPQDVAIVETQQLDKFVVVAETGADRVKVLEITEDETVVEIATIENLIDPTSVAVVEVIDPVTQVEKLQIVVDEAIFDRVLVFETPVETPFEQPIVRADAIVIEQANGLTLDSPQDVQVIEVIDQVTKQVVDEKLVIADTHNDRVVVYDLPIVEDVEPITIIADSIVEPTVIAADPINEKLLVVVEPTTAPQVVVYELTEVVEPTIVPVAQKVLDITIPQEVSVIETVVPTGIAVDPVKAHIVIADAENDRVLEFAPITTEIVQAQTIVELVAIQEIETVSEIAPKTIDQPEQIVMTEKEVLIADAENDRVVVISNIPVVDVNEKVIQSTVTIVDNKVVVDKFVDSTTVVPPTEVCGIQVDTTSLDYGTLQLDQVSTEAQIVLENAGNAPVQVFVKSAPWVDATGVEQISIENTKFSLVSEAATGLTSVEHFTQMTPATTTFAPILDAAGQPVEIDAESPLTTHWKMQADLLNQQFTGSLSQTMEFGITC